MMKTQVPGVVWGESSDGEQIGGGTGIVHDAMAEVEGVAERAFEAAHLGAGRDPRGQQHVDRGVDFVGGEGRLMQPHHRVVRLEGEVVLRFAVRADRIVHGAQQLGLVRH